MSVLKNNLIFSLVLQLIFNKIFSSKPKVSGILWFLVEHYKIKTDTIRYYSLTNSTALKFCNQKYEYAIVQNFEYATVQNSVTKNMNMQLSKIL